MSSITSKTSFSGMYSVMISIYLKDGPNTSFWEVYKEGADGVDDAFFPYSTHFRHHEYLSSLTNTGFHFYIKSKA